mgnify:CR=1 FL=1
MPLSAQLVSVQGTAPGVCVWDGDVDMIDVGQPSIPASSQSSARHVASAHTVTRTGAVMKAARQRPASVCLATCPDGVLLEDCVRPRGRRDTVAKDGVLRVPCAMPVRAWFTRLSSRGGRDEDGAKHPAAALRVRSLGPPSHEHAVLLESPFCQDASLLVAALAKRLRRRQVSGVRIGGRLPQARVPLWSRHRRDASASLLALHDLQERIKSTAWVRESCGMSWCLR